MLLASIVTFETLLVIFCLLALLCGLVHLTTRRQTEILKEYLQPEKMQIERAIMRLGKTPVSYNEEIEAENELHQE